MKNFKRSLLTMMILVVALLAIGCGSSDEDQIKYEGSYSLEVLKVDGNEMDPALLKMVEDQIFFELNSGGKGKMVVPGQKERKFAWEVKEGVLKLDSEEGALEGTIKDGKITIEDKDTKMVFKKK